MDNGKGFFAGVVDTGEDTVETSAECQTYRDAIREKTSYEFIVLDHTFLIILTSCRLNGLFTLIKLSCSFINCPFSKNYF